MRSPKHEEDQEPSSQINKKQRVRASEDRLFSIMDHPFIVPWGPYHGPHTLEDPSLALFQLCTPQQGRRLWTQWEKAHMEPGPLPFFITYFRELIVPKLLAGPIATSSWGAATGMVSPRQKGWPQGRCWHGYAQSLDLRAKVSIEVYMKLLTMQDGAGSGERTWGQLQTKAWGYIFSGCRILVWNSSKWEF